MTYDHYKLRSSDNRIVANVISWVVVLLVCLIILVVKDEAFKVALSEGSILVVQSYIALEVNI